MQTIVEPKESQKAFNKNENIHLDVNMPGKLTVSIGEYSDKGRKEINQDFHGSYYPNDPLLTSKGITLAIADGINNSYISQVASETSVASFLDDYYCTAKTWAVKRSAELVLNATNSWLHAQSQKTQGNSDNDKDYVCTFSTLILKSTTAHILHIGDTRIYRLRGDKLEQLTTDHCLRVSDEISYLNRGLGIYSILDIDYQSTPIKVGDIFFMTTDGVYEHVSDEFIADTIKEHNEDLDLAAELLVEQAYQVGSTDSLTAQLVKIEGLPKKST
ncbi:PP2C family serine/threonine-protein phosphatase [uncultured Cocleimonas sp.]|uniref:PP2C family protein-serine/threonine phosphatase n=1 Tax=uncultured Cocleimonas sp. TaxID=1051587 RepID=UPI0026096FA4|nr:PP2C family serine/threonine-protein phosphatase [uncultured Cocleimonas sp.]